MSTSTPKSNTLLRTGLAGAGFTILTVLLMLWLAGAFHAKVGRAGPLPERLVAATPLAEVRVVRLPREETAVGTIRAVHETSVAAKIMAKVVEVRARAGQPVTRGEVLVRLDDEDLRARVAQAAAAVDTARAVHSQARLDYERVAALYERNNAAKTEFDQVSTGLKRAEADLTRAEQSQRESEAVLSYATIDSPMDGVVVDRLVEVGDTATPGRPLLSLYDPTRMQLVAQVRESLTQRLSVGQSIPLRIDSLGKACEGRISEIVPEAQSASRTFSVKVTGPCPPGVYAGMFGRLLIPLDEEEVVVVPRAAVRRVGQLDIVDVAEHEMLHRRVVRLGRELGDRYEVLSGLRAGERVALADRPSRSDDSETRKE